MADRATTAEARGRLRELLDEMPLDRIAQLAGVPADRLTHLNDTTTRQVDLAVTEAVLDTPQEYATRRISDMVYSLASLGYPLAWQWRALGGEIDLTGPTVSRAVYRRVREFYDEHADKPPLLVHREIPLAEVEEARRVGAAHGRYAPAAYDANGQLIANAPRPVEANLATSGPNLPPEKSAAMRIEVLRRTLQRKTLDVIAVELGVSMNFAKTSRQMFGVRLNHGRGGGMDIERGCRDHAGRLAAALAEYDAQADRDPQALLAKLKELVEQRDAA